MINNRKENNYFRNHDVISGFSSVADAKPSMSESNNDLTANSEKSIMTVKETARFLRKSVSWVYKNSSASVRTAMLSRHRKWHLLANQVPMRAYCRSYKRCYLMKRQIFAFMPNSINLTRGTL